MPALAQMAPDLRRRVAEDGANPSPDPQYTTAMEGYISVAIIAPAFARANDDWTSKRVQRLADQAVQLETGIEEAIKQSSAAADQLAPLKSSIKTLRTVAQSRQLCAAGRPRWWRSVDSKDTSIQFMVESMKQGAGKISQQQAALATARDEASAAVKVRPGARQGSRRRHWPTGTAGEGVAGAAGRNRRTAEGDLGATVAAGSIAAADHRGRDGRLDAVAGGSAAPDAVRRQPGG